MSHILRQITLNQAVKQSIIKRGADINVETVKISKHFVDSLRVKFIGGKGGDGCISMMSLFANEFAGPDGGNGGNGGHVVLRAKSEIKSLNSVLSAYTGKAGTRGMGKHQHGASAPHTFVDVPLGTIVTPARPKTMSDHEYDPDQSPIVAELDVEGSMFIAARGGAGGRGNAEYLSNKNRHPRLAELGANGEMNTYDLRIRVYAHVGLIGLPNVGKSSLLKSLTGCQVKIGNYAFTTIHPQVGIIEYDDYSQLAISDLPGLIEDSHKNRGLGVQFLRSLQHCASLLYVIDLSCDPIEQFKKLMNEIESYRPGMSERPHLVFGNKLDHEHARCNAKKLELYLKDERPETKLLLGSSCRGDGLEALRQELKQMYDDYQSRNADENDQPLTW